MAKTENNQDPGNPEQLLTKTLLVNENLEDADDSTVLTESEPVLVKHICTHINKSVDGNIVRKNVFRSGFDSLKCFSCKQDTDLLLCLKCGSCNCSSHAQQHFESPRSDPHNLAVKISDWNVWCYKCNTEIPVEGGKLKEAIIVLRKEQNKPSKSVLVKQTNTDSDVTVATSAMEPTAHCSRNDLSSCMAITVGQKSVQSLPSARGLCNLGNTCFFNSVLQCLAQTPFLLELLMEISEPGEKAILNIDSSSQLLVELDKWGPVTEALAITLTQITQGSGGAYPPAHLLDVLRKRYRQFIGYNQHDAHELLRQLLDSVKTEDIRRYQVHILQHYGLSRKTNPEEVDEKKKAMAKELNQKLTEIVNIRPDPVFRGTLVSMHQCMKCHHKSEVVESFLDLSLPVSFLKTQAPSIMRRKNDFGEKTKSKHQKKKEKKAARKANRLAKINKRRLKDAENKNMAYHVIEMKDINESGYSSGKASSPILNNGDSIPHENKNEILAEALNEINSTPSNSINGDSDITKLESPFSDVFTDENPSADSKNNRLASEHSPTVSPNVNNGDQVVSSQSDELAPQQPEMRFRWLNSPVVPLKTTGSSPSSSSDDEKDDDEDNNDNIDDNESADGDDDVSGDELLDDSEMNERELCATLQTPSEYEENSIQACLSEFTACEVLTGNNRLKCESCTERQAKATGDKKPVYQPITKQLLIKSPPPVLILHLKRFEMRSAFSFSSVSLRKAEKVISFPLILDIGSFCAMNCEKLLVPGQKKILYSLYGVVEHSGSLNAGHYVAYVKVRKPVEKNSYRRLFLRKPYSNNVENINVDDLEQKVNEHRTSEKQWYYISDSYARAISEEEVLHKEAYLLFYERIL